LISLNPQLLDAPKASPGGSTIHRLRSSPAGRSGRTWLEAHFDEETGEMTMLRICLRCRQSEKLNANS
jgi:hypothetical protein